MIIQVSAQEVFVTKHIFFRKKAGHMTWNQTWVAFFLQSLHIQQSHVWKLDTQGPAQSNDLKMSASDEALNLYAAISIGGQIQCIKGTTDLIKIGIPTINFFGTRILSHRSSGFEFYDSDFTDPGNPQTCHLSARRIVGFACSAYTSDQTVKGHHSRRKQRGDHRMVLRKCPAMSNDKLPRKPFNLASITIQH